MTTKTISAQGNLPYFDDRPFHFGFSLGTNLMDFGVKSSADSINGEKYSARVSALRPGFSVGIITDLRISRYLNLRATPTLHFGEREIIYSPLDNSRKITIQSIPICIPVYLKYSSERKRNIRPYVIGGVGLALDLGRNTENPVLLNFADYYAEFGVGCDLYFSFFKLSPEIKYAVGLSNVFTPLSKRDAGQLNTDNQFFSRVLESLTSRIFTLTFNFE